MNRTLFFTYVAFGMIVCGWFTVAAAFRWKAPDLGLVRAINSIERSSSGYSGGGSYGRSFGGSWGGGK